MSTPCTRFLHQSWCLLLFLFAQLAIAQESVAFYIVADQDDWQLFMQKNAYADASNAKQKTVFITLTAGDAGLGKGGSGTVPYYQARDNGSQLSIKFLADIASVPDRSESAQYVYANAHQIYHVQYKHTKSYYLRLPEGNDDGNGYRATGNQSLKRLRDGEISKITAVDSSATYQGWTDLVQTIQRIIIAETSGFSYATLNIPETDISRNPDDHNDRLLVGDLAEQASKDLTCLKQYSWLGYSSADKPMDLSIDQLINYSAVFACNVAGTIQGGYRSNWDATYKQWIGRGEARTTSIQLEACAGVTINLLQIPVRATHIRNKATGKVLEIAEEALGAGAFLQQGTSKEANHQAFFFKKTPENLWNILPKHSNLPLDAYGGNIVPGTKVWQFRVNGTSAQNWVLEQAGDSSFYLKNHKSNLYLEANLNGTDVSLQTYIGNDAQRWYIIPGSDPLGPPQDTSSTLVAVKEIVEQPNIWKVFPNPLQSANEVNFRLTEGHSGRVKVKLYTLGGQLLSQEKYPQVNAQSTFQFSFPPLAHGVYLLELQCFDQGQIYQKVIRLVR